MTRREIKLTLRYASANIIESVLNSDIKSIDDEPMTYKEAINSNDISKWLEAMKEEM